MSKIFSLLKQHEFQNKIDMGNLTYEITQQTLNMSTIWSYLQDNTLTSNQQLINNIITVKE